MKWSKIAAVCKRHKCAVLKDQESKSGKLIAQWIGTTSALYRVEKLPYLTEESLCALLEVGEKERNNWNIAYRSGEENIGMNLSDHETIEWAVMKNSGRYMSEFQIVCRGVCLEPVQTEDGGLLLFDTGYLAPFYQEEKELYLRQSPMGMPYLSVKMGLMLEAVILPYRIRRSLRDFLQDMAQRADREVQKRDAPPVFPLHPEGTEER